MTIDQELQAALNVEPSPQFVARVRMRIANEPTPRGWNWWWVVPSAALGTAAVIAAVLVSRPPSVVHEDSGALLTARALPSNVAPAVAEPTWESAPAPRAARARSTKDRADDLVLIDPREMSALRRLIAGSGPARVAEAPWLRPSPLSIAEPEPLVTLEIPDLVIEPLPVGSEGVRQ